MFSLDLERHNAAPADLPCTWPSTTSRQILHRRNSFSPWNSTATGFNSSLSLFHWMSHQLYFCRVHKSAPTFCLINLYRSLLPGQLSIHVILHPLFGLCYRYLYLCLHLPVLQSEPCSLCTLLHLLTQNLSFQHFFFCSVLSLNQNFLVTLFSLTRSLPVAHKHEVHSTTHVHLDSNKLRTHHPVWHSFNLQNIPNQLLLQEGSSTISLPVYTW